MFLLIFLSHPIIYHCLEIVCILNLIQLKHPSIESCKIEVGLNPNIYTENTTPSTSNIMEYIYHLIFILLNPIPKTLSAAIRINNCCGIKLCLLHIYSFFTIKFLFYKTFVLY